MKKIILIRHAKSSWKFPELKDIERPLKKRGISDAAIMATVLKEKQLSIDKVFSSHAVRAMATANAIAPEIGIGEADISIDQRLYMESRNILLQIINELDDRFGTVALISHNPGLTDLANLLTDEPIKNIPTCGIVAIEFECNTWKEVEKKKGKRLFFEYPKKHRKEIEKVKS